MGTILKVDDINVYYGSIHAIKGISFEVEEGEVVTLIGANGAGKSTTLNTISGLLRSKTGSIEFMGQSLAKVPSHKIVERGLALVPEGRRIFLQMTVQENLEMGAFTQKGGETQQDLEKIYALFPRLKERLKQMAGTLSGGEQQRVAVARALAHAPKLVIADEPTGNIDPELSLEMMELLERVSEMGITVLVVTHEHELVRHFDRRVVTLSGGHIISDVPTGSMIPHPPVDPKELEMEVSLV